MPSILALTALMLTPVAVANDGMRGCPGGATTDEEVGTLAVAAMTGWSVLSDDAAVERQLELRRAIGCAGELLSSGTVAATHRSEAVFHHRLNDQAGALLSLQAARLVASDEPLPAVVLEVEAGLSLLYASAERAPAVDPQTLHPVINSTAYVDGVASSLRPMSLPSVVQVADARGAVYWSALLDPQQELPDDFPAVPETASRLILAAAQSLGLNIELGVSLRHTADHFGTVTIFDVDERALTTSGAENPLYCAELCGSRSTSWAYRRYYPGLPWAIMIRATKFFEFGIAGEMSFISAHYQTRINVFRNIDDPATRELVTSEWGTPAVGNFVYDPAQPVSGTQWRLDQVGAVAVSSITARVFLTSRGWRPWLSLSPELRAPVGPGRNNVAFARGIVGEPWLAERYLTYEGEEYYGFDTRIPFGSNFGVRPSIGLMSPTRKHLGLGFRLSYVDADAFLPPDKEGIGLVGALENDVPELDRPEHRDGWTADVRVMWRPRD